MNTLTSHTTLVLGWSLHGMGPVGAVDRERLSSEGFIHGLSESSQKSKWLVVTVPLVWLVLLVHFFSSLWLCF